MKYFLSFLLILIIGVFQTSVLPLNILLLTVLDLAILNDFRRGILIGFFSGLVLDLLSLGRLGLSSLAFLLIVFLINLYKRRWRLPNFWLILFLTFIFSFFFDLFSKQFWSVKEGGVLVLVNIVFYPLISFLQKKELRGQLKLRL